jgi:hypothetical protein
MNFSVKLHLLLITTYHLCIRLQKFVTSGGVV